MSKVKSVTNERRVFVVDGKEYAVRRPTPAENKEANLERSRVFNEQLRAGSLLRDQLDKELKKRNIWTDQDQVEYDVLQQEVVDIEYKLAKGGISLSQAKDLAIKMRKLRNEMVRKISKRTELDNVTCEGQADQARFNFLLIKCLVYNDTNEPVFKDVSEYDNSAEKAVAFEGATQFFYLLSGADDVDSQLYENKFLRKYKFANEDYKLVDKDGRLVDEEGRHVDENGRFIKWVSDTEHVFVDIDGRDLDEDGKFIVDHQPFLDEDGNPIDESLFETTEKQEETASE